MGVNQIVAIRDIGSRVQYHVNTSGNHYKLSEMTNKNRLLGILVSIIGAFIVISIDEETPFFLSMKETLYSPVKLLLVLALGLLLILINDQINKYTSK